MTTRGPLTLSRHSGGTLVGRERTALQLDEALGRQGVRVFATSPSGFKRELNISRKNGVFSTDFQPDEIGNWNFSVVNLLDGAHVEGSPFDIRVHDPQGVRVSNLDDGLVDVPCYFDVDASQAGTGAVDMRVTHKENPVNSDLLTGDIKGVHRARFTPPYPGLYRVEVFFEGNQIRGSPFSFTATDPRDISVKVMGLEAIKVNEPTSFEVVFAKNVNESDKEKLEVKIVDPRSKKLATTITAYSTMSFLVEFVPVVTGLHEMSVLYHGKQVTGSPFNSLVLDPSSVVISPANQIGTVGEPLTVIVDINKAGPGKVEIRVLKEGRIVPAKVTEVAQGMHQVTFTPEETKPHEVCVALHGISGDNCSLLVPVIDKSLFKILGEGVSYAAVNQPSTFKVIGSKLGQGSLSVDITSMTDGSIVPAVVKSSSGDGSDDRIYDVEYITRKIGDYRAEVKYNNAVIGEGPFVIKSFDPRRVKVQGLADAVTGVESEFIVDATDAGEGNMVIAIESAENRDLKCPSHVEVEGSQFKVTFTPTRGGRHKVNILFNDKPIAGNPFPFSVLDLSSIAVKSSTAPQGTAQVNRNVNLYVAAPNCDPRDFKINVKGPHGESVPSRVTASGHEGLQINFLPTTTGEHDVEVTYKGHPIPGFPQTIGVWDINRVKVSEIGSANVGKTTSFEVDASKAGAGQLEVTGSGPSGENLPIRVSSIGPGHYVATFTPMSSGQHELEVTFNGEHAPGSPFKCPVMDRSKVSVEGEGLGHVAANRQTSFDIKLGQPGTRIDERDLSVKIYDPSGQLVSHQLQGLKGMPDAFKVNFTPKKAGQHRVEVQWQGTELGNGPLLAEVFDRSAVVTSSLPEFVALSEPVSFDVDPSKAGNGRLEVRVQGPTTTYSANLSPSSSSPSSAQGKVRASFEPREAGKHEISVLFEGEPVKGSPFSCNVVDPKKYVAQWDEIKQTPTNKKARLEIRSDQSLPIDLISACVIDSSGDRLPISLLPIELFDKRSGGGAILEFFPITAGRQKIELSVLDKPISGSPFMSEAFDASDVKIEGLDNDVVPLKKPVEFVVRKSGPGEVRAKVRSLDEKPSRVIVTCRQIGGGATKFSFTPVDESDHMVEITCNDEPVSGFPKVIRVFNPDPPKPKPTPVEASSQYEPFTREMSSATQTSSKPNYDLAEVIVTAPDGQRIPARLTRQQAGDYKIDYDSPYVGRHKVEVLLDGEHVMDTPYFVDLHDVSKVDIISAKQKWLVGKPVDFEVVTKRAGDAKLNIKILEPNGSPLPIEDVPTGEGRRVIYTPKSEGPHRAFVTFGGDPVPGGNPLVQDVMKPSQVTALGSGLTRGLKDEPSRFFVDSKNQKGDLTVQVDGPNSVAKVNIESVQNGAYNITYVPMEVGHFDVFVRWNGKDIAGSPFRPKIVDPTKVKAVGGWDKVVDPLTKVMNLQAGEVNKIELDTKMAGPGRPTSEVMNLRSRVNVPVDVVRTDEDRYIVAFVPPERGDYLIRILWEDLLIPMCPITGNAKGSSSFSAASQTSWGGFSPTGTDVSLARVAVSGRGSKEATVGQVAEFIIDGTHGGPGKPKVKLSGRNMEIPIKMEPINRNLYRCSYEPRSPGKHFLNVDWAEEPVKGSPFEVNVSEVSDASKVTCSGEGLKKGILGQDVRASIDTRQAGPGSLEAQCIGPSTQATTTLRDLGDGTFTLYIKPQELGRHQLDIKYSGKHVNGSPFSLKIYPPPDPSRVTVYGPGVRHGLLADFRSHFFVDTTGAGAGQLTVRVKGPKGAFCVEMQRDNQRDRLITCRYDPSEKGEYIVQVKWSDVDIPGSPFLVRIVDTKEELNEALRTVPTPAELPLPGAYNPPSDLHFRKGPGRDNLFEGMQRTGKDTFIRRSEDPFYEAARNSKPIFRQYNGLKRTEPKLEFSPASTLRSSHTPQKSLFQAGQSRSKWQK